MTEYGFFCKGYIDISRSHNLVNFWNTFGTEGKCGNSLCTADFKHTVCTGFFCSYERGWIDFARFVTWGCHDDLLYTCYFGRHDIHQYRRWIDGFSTGNVYTGFGNRSYFLTEHGARNRTVKPTVLFLLFMINTDVFFCFADYF